MDWTHFIAGLVFVVGGIRWIMRMQRRQMDEWMSTELPPEDSLLPLPPVPPYPRDTQELSQEARLRIQQQLIPGGSTTVLRTQTRRQSKAAEQQKKMRADYAARVRKYRIACGMHPDPDSLKWVSSEEQAARRRQALEADFDD